MARMGKRWQGQTEKDLDRRGGLECVTHTGLPIVKRVGHIEHAQGHGTHTQQQLFSDLLLPPQIPIRCKGCIQLLLQQQVGTTPPVSSGLAFSPHS